MDRRVLENVKWSNEKKTVSGYGCIKGIEREEEKEEKIKKKKKNKMK